MTRTVSELRRGLSAGNLRTGALAALALGLGLGPATATHIVPDLLGHGALAQSLAGAAVLFALLTALHTAAHTYVGWRFERGVRAASAGDHRRAIRLLSPVGRAGMDHYDPDHTAREALAAARRALAAPRPAR